MFDPLDLNVILGSCEIDLYSLKIQEQGHFTPSSIECDRGHYRGK